MLVESTLSPELWGEAILTVNYLRNVSPCSANSGGKTPHEVWKEKKFNVSNLRPFGCDAWVTLSKEQQKVRGKMAPKAILTTMVGYSSKSKAYRLLDSKTGKFIETRHAVFLEENSKSGSDMIDESQGDATLMPDLLDEERDHHLDLETSQDSPEIGGLDKATSAEEKVMVEDKPKVTLLVPDEETSEWSEDNVKMDSLPGGFSSNQKSSTGTLMGQVYKYGFGTYFNQDKNEDDLAKDDINAPPKNASRRHQVNNVQLKLEEQDPLTYDQAMSSRNKKEWEIAMDKEMGSLNANGTWDLSAMPKNRKAVSSKWVYKTKREEEGKIIKHKARLVARGFSQKFGVDFGGPVANMNSIRIILSIAANFGLACS